MDDLLILVTVILWLGVWWARDVGWIGVRRGQGFTAVRRTRRRPHSGAVAERGPDGPYADVVGPRR